MISKDNVRRDAWPIEIVVKVITGAAGVPRTARIRTKKGEFTRPFQKLHLFEKCENVKNVLRESETSQEGEDVIIPHVTTRCGRVSRKPDVLTY